jgi:predicted nuclease of predicted toxin-antitoxin system
VKGILADVNAIGQVHALVQQMQAEPWVDFWTGLGLVLKSFEDVGLSPTSTDVEIWRTCQAEELILITDNRNQDSPDSLEATIRKHNQPDSLPVFTIGDLNKFQDSRAYAEQVLEQLYDYLLGIDELRGTGRLYLP